jgi:hypothetical protein
LQAAGEQVELTIRDAWEGEQHDVLPGTLPLPTPLAPEEPQLEPEAALASEAAPAAPITEAPAPEPVVAAKAASPEPVAVLETPAPGMQLHQSLAHSHITVFTAAEACG